jgi:hypothetical protein
VSVISLDDDEDDPIQRKKDEFKREVIKKAKENLKKPKPDTLPSKSVSEMKKSKDPVEV